MFRHLASILALTVAACSSSDDASGSSSSGSSSGEAPVDLNEKVSATECKTRCAKRVGKDGCGETQTEANKNCNAICRERATGHQMKCLEEDLSCDDLTHEKTIVELCPTATK